METRRNSARRRTSPKRFMQGLKNALGLAPPTKRHRSVSEAHSSQSTKQSEERTETCDSLPAVGFSATTTTSRGSGFSSSRSTTTTISDGAHYTKQIEATRCDEQDEVHTTANDDSAEDKANDVQRVHQCEDVAIKQEPVHFGDLYVYIVPDGKKVTKVQRKIWAQQLERLGAKVSNQLTPELTHIVVDNSLEMERIRNFFRKQCHDYSDFTAWVVTAEWVVCSLAERKPAMVEAFILEGFSLHRSEKAEQAKQETSSTTAVKDVVSSDDVYSRTETPKDKRIESTGEKVDPHKFEISEKMLEARKAYACVRSGDASMRRLQKNDDIVAKIEECAEILGASADMENIWREYQYKKAASMIRNLPYRVDPSNVHTLLKKKGIGKRMVDKVKEILQKGTFRKLEILKTQSSTKTMQDLTAIWGVGPKTAQKLSSKGIKSASDLREQMSLPDLSSCVDSSYILQTLQFSEVQLENAKELGLTTRGMQGLCFYNDLLQRIPREEVGEIEREIRCAAAKLWDGVTAICCGSYRRGKQSSGDVDVIITHDDCNFRHLSALVRILEKLGMLTVHLQMPHEDRFGKPEKVTESTISETYMGIGRPLFPKWDVQRVLWIGQRKCPQSQLSRLSDSLMHHILRFAASNVFRRIDLKSYRRDTFAFALLYFTGSDHFNRSMRAYAKRCGLTLTDKGLHACERFKGQKWWTSSTLVCHSEKEVFDALHLPYKKPEERNCYNEDVLDHEEADDNGESPTEM